MTIKVVTSFATLMKLAGKVGDAKKRGDTEALIQAEANLEDYRQLCLNADEMMINVDRGEL